MGCASSSPFVTSGNGVLTAAKGAATDAVHAGEGAINEVKDTLNEKVGVVKEAVIGAVQNVGHGIENAFSAGKKEAEEIGTMGNEVMEKTATTLEDAGNQIVSADKMIDDALEEIGETIDDKVTATNDMLTNTMDNMKTDIEQIITTDSPIHSLDMDSLKTTSPEPEIEKALANDEGIDGSMKNPPTPKPTLSELEKLHLQQKTMNSMDEFILNADDDDQQQNPIGGIYEKRKITESQAALIREGAAHAAIMANE